MRGRGASRVDRGLAVWGKDGTYSLNERGREVAAEVQERREAEYARLRLSKKLRIYG